MDVLVSKADLARELALTDRIIARKQTIPTLGYVLFDAAATHVTIAATDLDLALTSRCAAKVSGMGRQLAPARKLFDLVRTLPDGDVRLTTDGNGVNVSSGGFSARLQAPSSDDFPVIPELGAQVVPTEIPAEVFAEGLARVAFAVATDSQRFFLYGVAFECDGKQASLVATDGHRLALASWPLAVPTISVLVPQKAVVALMAMIDEAEEDLVTLTDNGTFLFFGYGDRMLAAKKVDGQFPAYKSIIPKDLGVEATVSQSAVAEAVRRATMIGEHAHVDLAFDKNGLEVAALSADVGATRERVPATYAGGPTAVTLKGSYVQDFLGVAGTDDVRIYVAKDRGPVTWRPVGGPVEYTYLVMPVFK